MRDERLSDEGVLGRDQVRGQVRGIAERFARRHGSQHTVVLRERRDDDERDNRAHGSLKDEPRQPSLRHRPLCEQEPEHEECVRDKNQHGLIPGTERLQRDEGYEYGQPPPGQRRDPAFQRHQREGNQEDPDHMEMPVALMHAVEAEREDDPGHGRGQMISRVPPRQRVRRERTEQERQEPDDVVSQYRISGQRVDRKGEEADAEQVFAVRQGVPCRDRRCWRRTATEAGRARRGCPRPASR